MRDNRVVAGYTQPSPPSAEGLNDATGGLRFFSSAPTHVSGTSADQSSPHTTWRAESGETLIPTRLNDGLARHTHGLCMVGHAKRTKQVYRHVAG
jgi:hypothetical protein